MSYYDPYSGYPSYYQEPSYQPPPAPAPVVSTSPLQSQLFPSLKVGSKPIPNYVYIIICVACVLLILCIIASVVSASANIGPPTTKPQTTTKPPVKKTIASKETSSKDTSSKDNKTTESKDVRIIGLNKGTTTTPPPTTTTTPPPTTTIPPLSIYCSDSNIITLMNKYPYWTSGDRISMLNILSNLTNNKDTSITNDNIYKKIQTVCEL